MKSAYSLIALLASVTLLAGCATIFTSPAIAVSPASTHGQNWTITGVIHALGYGQNIFAGTLSVYIDGKVVGSGPVGETPTNIPGTYESHAIQTVCPARGGPHELSYSCQVYVDGTLTAVLPFG